MVDAVLVFLGFLRKNLEQLPCTLEVCAHDEGFNVHRD
jgi:hypothetical protein